MLHPALTASIKIQLRQIHDNFNFPTCHGIGLGVAEMYSRQHCVGNPTLPILGTGVWGGASRNQAKEQSHVLH